MATRNPCQFRPPSRLDVKISPIGDLLALAIIFLPLLLL